MDRPWRVPPSAPGSDAVRVAGAQLEACRLVHDFIGAKVRPIVDRKKNPLPWTQFCDGMLTRSHGWLRSLLKLDAPGDFQAVLAGSRALFELALDFVLIVHEERGSFAKLRDWERCKQLRLAESLQVSQPGAAAFVKRYQQEIEALRVKHWPNKKGKGTRQSRWTGRNLEGDAATADALGAPEAGILSPGGFSEYARQRYSMNCWYVHGSGMIALHNCDAEYLPTIVALGRRDATRFAQVSARCALTLFKANDAIADARFRELDRSLAAVFDAALG